MSKRLSKCDLRGVHRPESARRGEFCQRTVFRQDSFAEFSTAEMHQLVPDCVPRHGFEMHFEQPYGCAETLCDGRNGQFASSLRANHVLDCAGQSTGIAQVLRRVTLKYSFDAVG